MRKTDFHWLNVFLIIILSAGLEAQVLQKTLVAIKDNTLYEDAEGDVSNGAGDYLFTGRTNSGTVHRALFEFPLDSLPANALIESATLKFTVSRIKTTTAFDHLLWAMNAEWGEGPSNAGSNEGSGAAASGADATWIYTFFEDQTAWNNPGGDYAMAATDTVSIGEMGEYAVELNENGIALLQYWYDTPEHNHGFMLMGSETSNGTSKRIDSRENPNVASRPVLVVDYSIVTSIGDEVYPVPGDLVLEQNYPNPFNPSTTIRYQLTKSADVTLKIYDLSGREVLSIFDAGQAAGPYEMTVDMTEFSSGVYFYRLLANGISQTRKMILTK